MKVTLRKLCEMRAVRMGLCHWEEYSNSVLTCVWNDPVYEARFNRELEVIEAKNFAPYFFIVYDLIRFAKSEMLVGPGRGSSAGSLVCYLLGITTVDPIKWDLLFERFLDLNRSDFPDIDSDVSEERRDNPAFPRCSLFNYVSRKYGSDRVARLGTVTYLRSHSALNVVVNQSLRIPKYETDAVAAAVIERSSGDDRPVLEETFDTVPIGQAFIAKHPEAVVVTKIEGHPFTQGTHACGLVLTNGPIMDYTALSGSGTTMCDGQDATEFNLLKVDVLGLSQLSIFERCLEIIDPCMKVCSNSGYFETLPLDDPAAFDVINRGRFSGVFQFQGGASQALARQVHIENIEDLAALTALVRPGPTNSGEATIWVRRKNGEEEVAYPHPLFEPILAPTLGCLVYQEQIMRIAREIGGMSWEDVTKLRKAISKKFGADVINKYREMFVTGAQANGVNTVIANKTFDEIVFHGNYSFNRSHAVAYAIVSYYCMYLKAHFPIPFAAATLDKEGTEPDKQLTILRELYREGVNYVSVDPSNSVDRWSVGVDADGHQQLVGPLTSIKGIGPAFVKEIMEARVNKTPLRENLQQKLNEAKTAIDDLFPVMTLYKRAKPNLNIVTRDTAIEDVQAGVTRGTVMIVGKVTKMTEIDETEPARVAKRGGREFRGPTKALNMWVTDDSGEIFVKVGRQDFERLGKPIINHGQVDKAVYAFKGYCPDGFRMIDAKGVLFVGDLT